MGFSGFALAAEHFNRNARSRLQRAGRNNLQAGKTILNAENAILPTGNRVSNTICRERDRDTHKPAASIDYPNLVLNFNHGSKRITMRPPPATGAIPANGEIKSNNRR